MEGKLLLAALALASKGYSVFPCKPEQKVPLTTHGFHDATNEEAIITAWWQKTPAANIGLPTGKTNNISVIDIDSEEGWDIIARLNIPPSFTIQTPRGGRHIYYKYMPELQTGANIMQKIDVRNDGAYVLVPPSIVNGNEYKIIHHLAIQNLPFNPLPKAPKANGTTESNKWIVSLLKGVPERMRNDTAIRLVGYFHKKNIPADVIYQILVPFASKCSPPMELEELQRTIESVQRYSGIKVIEL